MSQRHLDNNLTDITLPRLYAYPYHERREATSSLCFRPARADARAAHHLPVPRNGDEPPGPRLIPDRERTDIGILQARTHNNTALQFPITASPRIQALGRADSLNQNQGYKGVNPASIL